MPEVPAEGSPRKGLLLSPLRGNEGASAHRPVRRGQLPGVPSRRTIPREVEREATTTRIPTEEERRARERKATGEKDREERVKVGAEEPGDPARRIVTGGSGYAGKQRPAARYGGDLLARFHGARKLEAAPSTVRSRQARLKTWDRVVDELVARELAPRPSPSGSLTADLLKKGAAWLRATGYRSGDLYVSAAVRRHLATHGGTAVGLEEKEAIRTCRRGRGPPAGKQPVPYPTTQGAFSALLQVGIWWLLRVQEIIGLNLEDVVVYRAGERIREMGLWIWRSKTDEEDLGALVVRQCVCGEASLAHCPSCVLWRHAQDRRLALQGHGAPDGVGKAPLFDNGQGLRLTVAKYW